MTTTCDVAERVARLREERRAELAERERQDEACRLATRARDREWFREGVRRFLADIGHDWLWQFAGGPPAAAKRYSSPRKLAFFHVPGTAAGVCALRMVWSRGWWTPDTGEDDDGPCWEFYGPDGSIVSCQTFADCLIEAEAFTTEE
jgi:hypothetical protein